METKFQKTTSSTKRICSNKAVYFTARDASIWGLQISQFDQLKIHIPKSLPPSMKKKMNLKQVFVIFAFICKLSRKSREVQRSAFCFVLTVRGRRRTATPEPGWQRHQEKPEAGRGLSIRNAWHAWGRTHSNTL